MEVEYKIIGGDETEYGPVTLEELKSWIQDGRVAGMTQIWRSDLAMWSPADRYTELLEELHHQNVKTEVRAQATARPTGFWARFGAYVIDHIVLTVIFIVVWTPIATAKHWVVPQLPAVLTDAAVQQFRQQFAIWVNHALPIFYPLFFIYDVALNGRFGATVGKMLIGAKITMVDGSPIGYTRAMLRWFGARLSDFLFLTGYLLIAIRPDKRALHDLLVGTKVVYKR